MKGASYLLAVIITLILVISVGVMVFMFSNQLFRDRSRFAECSIDANLIVREGYAVLNIKIRNLGTYEINRITVTSTDLTVNGSKLNHEFNVLLHNGENYENSIQVDINSVKNPSKIIVKVVYVDGEETIKTFYLYPLSYS